MKPAGLAPIFLLAFSFSSAADLVPSTAADVSSDKSASPSRPPQTSAETTAKLAERLPKFSPPKSADAKPSPDRRETDRPRNTIIRLPHRETNEPGSSAAASATDRSDNDDGMVRLPNYDVREHQLPNFRERELLTPKGRLDLALKRHPGLKFGPFASLNNFWGLEMLAEENKVERVAEMNDLFGLMRFADAQQAQETQDHPAAAETAR